MKIISGGQTGVDRAALDVALDLSIPCGGYCPKGRKAEDGVIPSRYPLQCLSSANYRVRTLKNLRETDATLIFFTGRLAGGTWLTADMCRVHHKPFMTVDAGVYNKQQAAEAVLQFIVANEFHMLNVAGPRKSQWPEGYDYVYEVLQSILTQWQRRNLDEHLGD